jgi:hypothetical protein
MKSETLGEMNSRRIGVVAFQISKEWLPLLLFSYFIFPFFFVPHHAPVYMSCQMYVHCGQLGGLTAWRGFKI